MLLRTCRLAHSVFIVVAALVCVAPVEAQNQVFGPPAPLNTTAAGDTGVEYFQSFATDGAGHWVAVWEHAEPGPGGSGHGYLESDIFVARSADDGITWTPPAPLRNPALDNDFDGAPAITTDGAGTWVAVWRILTFSGTTRTDDDLLMARSTDDGATWSVPTFLNLDAPVDTGRSDGLPQITTDGAGTWVAVWHALVPGGGGHQIFSARSTDGGVTWSTPSALNGAAHGIYPRIATGGSTWVVVWEGSSSGETDVMTAHSTDGGLTWSPSAPVNTNAAVDTDYDLMPHVATDRTGTWVAVWTVLHDPPPNPDDLGERDVLVARSTDGGATWTAPAPLNTNAATDSGDDDVAFVASDGNGTWIAAWMSYDSLGGTLAAGYGNILQARSTDGGATWTAPAALNNDAPFDECRYRAYGGANLAAGTAGVWVAMWGGGMKDCPVDYGLDGDLFVARASTACGNGSVNAGEDCDDGGLVAGDGCDPSCHTEPPPSVCGNGVHEHGEECDDGNAQFDDGCDPSCHFDPPPSVCGDGVVTFDEACDDGNHDSGDGCDESCHREPWPSLTCGDGVIDAGEDCDDGNRDAGDGCDPGCHFEPCRPAPDASCRAGMSAKTSIKLRHDPAAPHKNRLDWKWRGIDATTKADFGTPTVNESYHVCVYAAGALVSTTQIHAAATCDGKPCWRGTGSGFTFRDKSLVQDGARQLDLRAGAAGKATLRFSGRGTSFETPPLPATGSVVVQVRRSTGPICWSATFSAPFRKNAGGVLMDAAD